MKAIVTTAFDGVTDGSVYPTRHEVGDIIDGDLGFTAVQGGLADPEDKKAGAEAVKAAAAVRAEADKAQKIADDAKAFADAERAKAKAEAKA